MDEIQRSLAQSSRLTKGERSQMLGQLFEQFPYGIVLLGGDGTVLEINTAARRLLGLPSGTPGSNSLTCCELFGCRAPGTPLEQRCLTQLTAEAKSSPGEIRIDLAPGSGATAVWLTSSLVEPGPARVLVHLRPADRRDRRRANVPTEPAETELEIFTLGRTMVRGDGGSLNGPWLRQRPGMVLKYLVCERNRAVPADEIAETLWPRGDQRAVGNVRHFVHSLRAHVEPGRAKRTPSRFVIAEPGGYRLNTEAVKVDADEFQQNVRSGLQRLKRGEYERAERLLVDAMQLYGGDFLADEPYALWAFAERDQLRDLAGEALGAEARLRRLAGDIDGAAGYLERRADMYPLDGEIQRDVIAGYLEQGRLTRAQRRYASLRHRMREEFGREPPFDLPDVAASVARAADEAAADGGAGP